MKWIIYSSLCCVLAASSLAAHQFHHPNTIATHEVGTEVECASCSLPSMPATTTDDAATAMKVLAGATYRLRPAFGELGGGWTAKFGSIGADGTYSAPNYMPPFGLDEIRYRRGGVESYLLVVIAPNPSLTNSDGVRYIKLPVSWQSSDFDAAGTAQVVEGTAESVVASGTLTDLTEVYPDLPIVGPGDDFPSPVQTSNCKRIVFDEQVGPDHFAGHAPSLGEGDNYDDMMLILEPVEGQAPPLKCTLKPRFEDISGDHCTGADVYMWKKFMYGPTVLGVTTGQMSVSASMALEIKNVFGIEVSASVQYPLTRIMLKFTEKVVKDRYSCQNGKLKFMGTQRLCRSSFGEVTTPIWAAFVDGYPKNGQPLPWDGIPYADCE